MRWVSGSDVGRRISRRDIRAASGASGAERTRARLPDVPVLDGRRSRHRADDRPHVPMRGGAGRSDHV